MGLTVTVLGCSGTWAAAGGACSGYLLRTPSVAVWLDAGNGTLANVQGHVGLDRIDAVVISHEHPDHWLELPVLRNALRYGIGRDHVPVYGTAGTLSMLEGLTGGRVGPTFRWQTVTADDAVDVGDLHLTFARTAHPVETLAVRASHDGRSFAYSADTGPGFEFSTLDPEREGFDLVCCEATLSEEEGRTSPVRGGHLTGGQAGAAARAAGARRLVVTHVSPLGDASERVGAATSTFGAPAELAAVGAVLTV